MLLITKICTHTHRAHRARTDVLFQTLKSELDLDSGAGVSPESRSRAAPGLAPAPGLERRQIEDMKSQVL